MKNVNQFLLVVCLLVTFNCHVRGQEHPDTLHVLAIGNSFSQDAVEQYLHEHALTAGKTVIIGKMYLGGAPLSQHWLNTTGDKDQECVRKVKVVTMRLKISGG